MEEIHSDGVHLLQLLPKIVWEKVADCVDDGDDLHNLVKSSPFFESLLESNKKVIYLFPSVLPMIENFLQDSLLNLRLVCKIWSCEVDKLIQKISLQRSHFSDQPVSKGVTLYFTSERSLNDPFYDYWDDPTICTQILHHFHETHAITGAEGQLQKRSPFISGKVQIRFNFEWEEAPEIICQSLNILKSYGHHVQQFTIDAFFESKSPTEIYRILRQFIDLMPNLKALTFNYQISRLREDDPEPLEDVYFREELAQRPMPFLKDLQLLANNSGNSKYFNPIVQLNNHVSTLIIGYINEDDEDLDIYNIPMPNLQRLSICFKDDLKFQKLIESSEFTWPLTRLQLTFHYPIDQLSTLFDLINRKWGQQLTHFNLHLTEIEDSEVSRFQNDFLNLRLNCPNLKDFHFDLRCFSSLDFLLPAKRNLEYLRIACRPFSDSFEDMRRSAVGVDKEIVKFLGSVEPFVDSNIWQIFPKLKQVIYLGNMRIGRLSFSRQDWEIRKEKAICG